MGNSINRKSVQKRVLVIAIVSGDTVTVLDGQSAYPVKLSRVTAPNIRSKKINEQTMANASQYALGTQILQHEVTLKSFKTTGMAEAEIFVMKNDDKINVNNWMLQNKYAYDPETDIAPTDWVTFHMLITPPGGWI